jgi:DnaA family protein
VNAQLPLALRWPADQRLEGFVGHSEARDAVAALAADAGGVPLYLVGPAGSGKTHLLLAACAAAESAGRQAHYVPLGACAGRVADAVEGRRADIVCVDGLDAVAGDRADEEALFHLHNRVRDAGGALLYAARVAPAELPPGLPDLRSRLGQARRLRLAPLDEAGRRAALVQRAARRGLELDDAVLDYLFRRVGRDLGTLGALLDRLDRESLAAQRRITVPFLRAVMGDS